VARGMRFLSAAMSVQFCVSALLLALAPQAVSAARSGPGFPLPATFAGTTPCADCAAIDVTLTLAANGTYAERNVYRGKATSFEDAGIWRYESSSESLILSGAHGSTTYYRVVNAKTLERLDPSGDPLVSSGNFRLTRSPQVVALHPAAPLGLASRLWSLVELGGEKPALPEGASVPSLRFDAAARRVSGTSGCNNFAGSYTQSGPALRFSLLATTRMACAPPLDALEARFLDALNRTTGFKVEGNLLELRDGRGVLAIFRALR